MTFLLLGPMKAGTPEWNYNLHGISFIEEDVDRVLLGCRQCLAGSLILDFDETVLDIESQDLLDKTQFALRFYKENGRFPTEDEEKRDPDSDELMEIYKGDPVREDFEYTAERKAELIESYKKKGIFHSLGE